MDLLMCSDQPGGREEAFISFSAAGFSQVDDPSSCRQYTRPLDLENAGVHPGSSPWAASAMAASAGATAGACCALAAAGARVAAAPARASCGRACAAVPAERKDAARSGFWLPSFAPPPPLPPPLPPDAAALGAAEEAGERARLRRASSHTAAAPPMRTAAPAAAPAITAMPPPPPPAAAADGASARADAGTDGDAVMDGDADTGEGVIDPVTEGSTPRVSDALGVDVSDGSAPTVSEADAVVVPAGVAAADGEMELEASDGPTVAEDVTVTADVPELDGVTSADREAEPVQLAVTVDEPDSVLVTDWLAPTDDDGAGVPGGVAVCEAEAVHVFVADCVPVPVTVGVDVAVADGVADAEHRPAREKFCTRALERFTARMVVLKLSMTLRNWPTVRWLQHSRRFHSEMLAMMVGAPRSTCQNSAFVEPALL